MNGTPHTPGLGDERGFTLVELLVAMTMSILILFGILNTLDNFSSNAARQTRVTDANDQVRRAMDRIVADLRQAATIEVAAPNNLAYAVKDSTSVTRHERVCLDSSQRLWRSSGSTATTAAMTCPSAGASRLTPLTSANSASNPLFRYDTTSPTADAARSIGLTFAFNAGNVRNNDVSTLRASAFRRSKGETATTSPVTITTTSCSSSNVPTLKLTSTAGPVTVQYTDTSGNVLGSGSAGTSVVLSSATPTATTVLANVTTSTGIVSQLVKVLVC